MFFTNSNGKIGFSSSFRGESNSDNGGLCLHSSSGVSYVGTHQVRQGIEYVDNYKIMFIYSFDNEQNHKNSIFARMFMIL